MEKLLQKLTQFFKQPTALESYINSKCPTNAAEVEFWARQYQQQQNTWRYL
jgi:hypothetical protein